MSDRDPYSWHEPLTWFYRDMQDWIDAGCRYDHLAFRPSNTLCANAWEWDEVHTYNQRCTAAQLCGQFGEAGLSMVFPFGPRETSPYTNPARLAWIKEHVK